MVRIAGLLHLAGTFTADHAVPISEAAMAGAIEIGHYLIAHALAAFDAMAGDPVDVDTRHVLRWLSGRTTFTKRECFEAHRSRLPRATDLDAVLALLADHGSIRAAPREAGLGRPSARYEVHPAARSIDQEGRPE